MKRKVFLKSFTLFIICLLFLITGSISVSADELITEHNKAKYRVTSVVEENYLYGGIKHTKHNAESSFANNTIDSYIGQTFANRFYTQSVNAIEVPNNGSTKIVQWSYLPSTPDKGWMLTAVNIMATNYESHNPGYKVLAVINGDFFDINSNGGYGPLLKSTRGVGVSDGEVIRAMDARGLDNNPLTIGFKNNGKSDNYVQGGKIEFSSNHVLALYDEKDNIIEEIEVKYINQKPSSGEVFLMIRQPTRSTPITTKPGAWFAMPWKPGRMT